MSLLRAFIAIEFPAPVCDAIEKQTARLRRTLGSDFIRWIPTHNMHLTLKFLGDTAASHLDFLKQLLAREADSHPQFDLQLGGLGTFPSRHTPRLLWIGIHAPAELSSLQRSVELGALRLGYKPEDRAFSPHLTLGRVRQTASLSELQKIRNTVDTTQLGSIGVARVDAIHLFKSDLQSSGPVYTKLFSAPLIKP
ncbi:MAG: RNA 2',3'-cyclic phosphodiesterase [Chloroflexi bacterium]|nr:RNA 2',3'-cyclic phosphodiesterase [Chloroflexota bacterium]